jgi:hypothetical protein
MAGYLAKYLRAGVHVVFRSHLDPFENRQRKWLARLHRHGQDPADPLEQFCRHRELMQWLESMLGVSAECWWLMQRLQYVPEYPSFLRYVQVSAGVHLEELLAVQPVHESSAPSSMVCVFMFVKAGRCSRRAVLVLLWRQTRASMHVNEMVDD